MNNSCKIQLLKAREEAQSGTFPHNTAGTFEEESTGFPDGPQTSETGNETIHGWAEHQFSTRGTPALKLLLLQLMNFYTVVEHRLSSSEHTGTWSFPGRLISVRSEAECTWK